MDSLLAARAQMEVSLAFHMVFAALGIGMPLLMVAAEGLWLRTGREHYRALARKWAKATALTFAVGAVSGTALSFELGLLWPRFMAFAGAIVGPAFALEGYAFFIEAIFLGSTSTAGSGSRRGPTGSPGSRSRSAASLSGILVVAANAWMQTPSGFRLEGGELVDVDPFAVFTTPAWFQMALHSSLSCYIATGFAVAGVYAAGMLRGRRDAYHRSALRLSLALAAVTALLQPLSGDLSARNVAEYQPAKLAAMEAHFETASGVPLLIGGIPDEETGEVSWALRIPRGAEPADRARPRRRGPGAERVPARAAAAGARHPPGLPGDGGLRDGADRARRWVLGAPVAPARRRRARSRAGSWRRCVAGSPLGFLALEAGWIVTEVGRQPWVVYGVMRTRDGVTPLAEVPVTFWGFSLLYLVLGIALVALLRGLAERRPGRERRGAPDAGGGPCLLSCCWRGSPWWR